LTRAGQGDRYRALVLPAARQVYLAGGYHVATLHQIADAAGFSKGVVYSQFLVKADLFLGRLEARIEEGTAARRARHRQPARRPPPARKMHRGAPPARRHTTPPAARTVWMTSTNGAVSVIGEASGKVIRTIPTATSRTRWRWIPQPTPPTSPTRIGTECR
jgi:AcrR family transcriptional regulator